MWRDSIWKFRCEFIFASAVDWNGMQKQLLIYLYLVFHLILCFLSSSALAKDDIEIWNSMHSMCVIVRTSFVVPITLAHLLHTNASTSIQSMHIDSFVYDSHIAAVFITMASSCCLNNRICLTFPRR